MAFVIKAFVNRADKDPNIGLIEKISYGLGDFSSQLLLTPVSMVSLTSWSAISLSALRARTARPALGSCA